MKQFLLFLPVAILISLFITTLISNNTIFPLELINTYDFASRFEPPENWKVETVGYWTAEYIGDGWWEIYVKLRNKDTLCWTNDFIHFNEKTKEIRADFKIGGGEYGFQGVCD